MNTLFGHEELEVYRESLAFIACASDQTSAEPDRFKMPFESFELQWLSRLALFVGVMVFVSGCTTPFTINEPRIWTCAI
jgi:hypothetical protein